MAQVANMWMSKVSGIVQTPAALSDAIVPAASAAQGASHLAGAA